MKQHTPGPWTPEMHPLGHYSIFQRDRAYQVAEVSSRGGMPEMVAANASLIAAAPEMLAALVKWQRVERDYNRGEMIDACKARDEAIAMAVF